MTSEADSRTTDKAGCAGQGALRCRLRWARRLLLLAVAALSLLAGAARAASPAQWKENGYGYNARGVPLRQLLQDFALSNGVQLKLSGQFKAIVRGRLQGATVTEFLERLASQYRLQWFVYNNTLYVSPDADMVTDRIEVGVDSVADAKSALTGLGLFDPRFGWGEFADEGVVVVTGPPAYVRLARELLKPAAGKQDDMEVMVFRLKYAAIEDRTVNVRDQTIVTPGVATLLKNMIHAADRRPQQRTLLPEIRQSDLTMPQIPVFTPPGAGAGASAGAGQGGLPARTASLPRNERKLPEGVAVEGDVRTNSIIIFDSPKKHAYYQRLIDALDVPQRLVEIEAMIIDIDRNRLKDLGVDFSFGRSDGKFAGNSVASTLAGQVAGSGASLVVSSLNHFFAQLHNLESEGEARVLAKPSISTLENLVAVLDLSQTVYIQSIGERVAQVTPVTAGTLLRVTPRVIDGVNGTQIHLTVDIEDGKVTERANGTPDVQRSTISTQAVLANHESLVIGGYDVDSSSDNLQEVPGLSKVPLFGGLFSNRQAGSESRQRLFIITPRLVPSLAERAQVQAAMRARERQAQQEFQAPQAAPPAQAAGAAADSVYYPPGQARGSVPAAAERMGGFDSQNQDAAPVPVPDAVARPAGTSHASADDCLTDQMGCS
jgi:type III secretion protein C